MNDLSNELFLHILSYLSEADQLEWCGCTRNWYDEILRGHIRKYRFRFSSKTTKEEITKWLERLYQVIRKPSNQVELYFYNPVSNVYILFPPLNFTLRKTSFVMEVFEMFSRSERSESVQMTELEITFSYGTIAEEKFIKSFRKISGFRMFSIDMRSNNYQVPYISTVKELTIEFSSFPHPVHVNYIYQLEKLELFHCYISDVSMLGSIPDLSLYGCPNITNISAFNHNRRVVIEDCKGIQDFTRSFENTESISIYAPEANLLPENWKKVKSLTLAISAVSDKRFEVPPTVVKCRLQSKILSSFVLTVSPSHVLRELVIRNLFDDKITSFENLGFERLVVIELAWLPYLSSLHGVGSGNNQKIIINNCYRIRDYSPLRYVPEVKITTENTVNLDQLDHVHTLTVKANQLVVSSDHCYEHIKQLDIRMVDNIDSFYGLVRIPVISFSLTSMKRYLEIMVNTKEVLLRNQRIDFIFSRGIESEDINGVESLYRRFLESQYSFLHPKKIAFDDYRVSLLRKNI